jgi:hypothetical protein
MTGVEIGLGIAALVGTGAQVYGNVAAARSQEEAARREAEFKMIQADELMERQRINEQIMVEQGDEMGSAYVAAFASTGRGGGGVGGQLRIKRDVERSIANSHREAEFKAKMLRAGADVEMDLASDAVSAAWISSAGSVLTTGANVYNLYKPNKKAENLPTTGTGEK